MLPVQSAAAVCQRRVIHINANASGLILVFPLLHTIASLSRLCLAVGQVVRALAGLRLSWKAAIAPTSAPPIVTGKRARVGK